MTRRLPGSPLFWIVCASTFLKLLAVWPLGGKTPEGDEEDERTEDEEDTELVPLPEEIAHLFEGVHFADEEQLHGFMDQKEIADFRLLLVDGKVRLRMPTDQHNKFTGEYCSDFTRSHGEFGYATATHNVHLLSQTRHREPDLSFFGVSRCVRNRKGNLKPYDDGAVPDVIIQFSWRNKRGYEEVAIDDMMTSALERERGPTTSTHPRVGYLIKVRFSKKRTLPNAVKGTKTQDMSGLDVYKLPHSTTVDDAIHGRRGATKWTYIPGGIDSEIVIGPQDLGILGPGSVACPPFILQLSDIFEEMNEYHQKRQLNGLST